MVTTLKVGKLEITSDQTKSNEEFYALVDGLAQRIAQLIPLDIQLETGQAATPASTAATPATSAVQTVTTV